MNTEVVSWQEAARVKQAQQQAQLAASTEGRKYISFKSGVMNVDKTPVPNNTLPVIALAFATENSWYAGKYDPTKPQTPACWSVYTGEEMTPDPECADIQADNCKSCDKFKWGSDPQGGRGKACKTRIRIAVLPGDVNSVEEVKAAEIRFAMLPVTSTKDFATFMQTCQLKTSRPMFGVVSELKCTPDAKSQFKVTLTPLRAVPDDLMLAILDRVNKAEEEIVYKYQSFEEEAQAPAKPLK